MRNDICELVTIIVPMHNSEKYINDSIKTIENQQYNNYEVIYIDNASEDNTVEHLKEKISYLKNKDKYRIKESYTVRNKNELLNIAINEAKGRYIAFLEMKDLWSSIKLKKQINFMYSNNYAISYSGYEYANELGVASGKEILIKEKMNFKNALKERILFSTLILDRNKIKDIELNEENIYDDTTICYNFLKRGEIAYGINNSMMYYRIDNDKIDLMKGRWKYYRKIEHLSIIKSCYYYLICLVKQIINIL